ncbi:IclR family transcriptional regulator [Asticcacaulis sp. AC460]|uniref:IclR family transcriptional regulator n=1 Tax=Asticcacaulis sp. AC460 TaxID=1282360 RepID=UPI00138AF00C|nr:helix-turn-helix domain-containing protein [Asticcacaulis sp. AC460]
MAVSHLADVKAMAERYPAPALEKGLDILELLAEVRAPMTLSRMAQHFGRSLTEIYRMIQVLEHRGYLFEPSRRDGYALTGKLFSLALNTPLAQALVGTALPAMEALSLRTGHACYLAIASGDQSVVVARAEAPACGFNLQVGFRADFTETAAGQVLAGAPGPIRRDRAWINGLTELACPVYAGAQGVVALSLVHAAGAQAMPLDDVLAALRVTAADLSAELAAEMPTLRSRPS